MKFRRFSPKTIKSYVYAVEDLAKYYNRSPDRISEEEVHGYLLYLQEERKLTWGSCNAMAGGLNFFYKTTLREKNIKFRIPKRKQARKLPTIFSRSDLIKLFDAADTLRNRMMLIIAYSAGLRVSELVSLKPEHIESKRKLIRVKQGKGNKDRYSNIRKLKGDCVSHPHMVFFSETTWTGGRWLENDLDKVSLRSDPPPRFV